MGPSESRRPTEPLSGTSTQIGVPNLRLEVTVRAHPGASPDNPARVWLARIGLPRAFGDTLRGNHTFEGFITSLDRYFADSLQRYQRELRTAKRDALPTVVPTELASEVSQEKWVEILTLAHSTDHQKRLECLIDCCKPALAWFNHRDDFIARLKELHESSAEPRP